MSISAIDKRYKKGNFRNLGKGKTPRLPVRFEVRKKKNNPGSLTLQSHSPRPQTRDLGQGLLALGLGADPKHQGL